MKKKMLAALAVVAAAAAVVVVYTRSKAPAEDGGDTSAESGREIAEAVPEKSAASAAKGAPSDAKPKAPKTRRKVRGAVTKAVLASSDIDDRDDLTPDEKNILKTIEAAEEAEDIVALRSVLPAVAASENTEIRAAAVDALGWLGKKAVLDLLPFMADKDSEIAESAVGHWTTALSEVSDDRRSQLVEETMKIITDEEMLQEIVDQVDDLDEAKAVQILVNIISVGNPTQAAVAREEYEFITGEEYTTFEAAEQWVRENCQSDDGDEPDSGE